jgi:hypothetical protein
MASADKSSGSRGADEDSLSGRQSDESDESEELDDSRVDEVDEWGEESFPASDPPASWSGPPDT